MPKTAYSRTDVRTLAHHSAMACETLRLAALGHAEISPHDMRELRTLLAGIRRSADAAYRILQNAEPRRMIIAGIVSPRGRRPSSSPSQSF